MIRITIELLPATGGPRETLAVVDVTNVDGPGEGTWRRYLTEVRSGWQRRGGPSVCMATLAHDRERGYFPLVVEALRALL